MSKTQVTKQISNDSFCLLYDFHEGAYVLEVSYFDGSGGSVKIEEDSFEDFLDLCEIVIKEGLTT